MPGTDIVSYKERFAKDAAETAATFSANARNLSTRGGTFSLGGETLGPRVAVVIVDAAFENAYYDGPFDPDNPMPPICYAISRDKAGLGPHPTMQADLEYFKPQHFPCQGCAMAEFGSAPVGKGKACRNKARLIVIPAGYYAAAKARGPVELHLFEEPIHFAKADAVGLSVPTMSVENWSKYAAQLSAAHQRPPYAVFTEVNITAHQKYQFVLNFEMLDLVPDELFETIMRRVDDQKALPFAGYAPPSAEDKSPFMRDVRNAQTRGRR